MERILVVACATVCVFSAPTTDLPADPDDLDQLDLRPTANHLEQAMAEFTQEFYLHMAQRNERKNFVFSPLSLHSALTLLFLGSTPDSETYNQLRQGLYGLAAGPLLKEEYKKLVGRFADQESFRYGNKIWLEKNFTVKDDYKNDVFKYLGAEAETTNFADGSAVDRVNKWVNNKTGGLITKLVEGFSPDTKLFLSNALYFKEGWEIDFEEEDYAGNLLDREEFHVLDPVKNKRLVKRVPMMQQLSESTFKYGEMKFKHSVPAKVVGIPYRNRDFEMQLIIPDSKAPNALGMLEDAMKTIASGGKTTSSLANLFLDKSDVYKRRAGSEVGIKMPKFKIATSLDAATIFTDMGIDKPFGAAELDRISDMGHLSVSRVVHKAVVEVAKNGTIGGAATGVELVLLSATFGQPIRVTVDQPFIFIVQDVRNKIPILVGRVMDPTQPV